MGVVESDVLCARLTGDVANKAADEFYKEFNLISKPFAEYFFNEMKTIFHLEAMDGWPRLMASNGKTEMSFSLVSFNPPEKLAATNRSVLQTRISTAHSKALAMLQNCFDHAEDKMCIQKSMEMFPTIAIFMALLTEREIKKMKKRAADEHKSILDVKDSASVHCLAAANYF